jgi:hypothetical protein
MPAFLWIFARFKQKTIAGCFVEIVTNTVDFVSSNGNTPAYIGRLATAGMLF